MTPARRSSNWSKNRRRFSAVCCTSRPAASAAWSLCPLSPNQAPCGTTRRSCARAGRRRLSSTTERASCAMTKTLLHHRARRASPPPRPASLRASFTLTFDACTAGTSPNTRVARRHTAPTKVQNDPVEAQVHPVRHHLARRCACLDRTEGDGKRTTRHSARTPDRWLLPAWRARGIRRAIAGRSADRVAPRAARMVISRGSRCRPREQQARDVRARNQQHERGCAHERHQDWLRLPDADDVPHRTHQRPEVFVGGGKAPGEPGRNRLELGPGGRDVGGPAQSCDDIPERSHIALLWTQTRGLREWLPRLRDEKVREARGYYADNHRLDIVDPDGLADARGVGPVSVPQDVESEDDDGSGARLIVALDEGAPQERPRLEEPEQVG